MSSLELEVLQVRTAAEAEAKECTIIGPAAASISNQGL